jgi:2-polyprenyl-3-methyl-5-hydroxy-6-metoxy-1,4-benzoquinol methylase
MDGQARPYDELWRTDWGDMQRHGPVHRHMRDDLLRVVSRLTNCRTILDVGCGLGNNLHALSHLGRYELTGVDVSQEALARARDLVPDARFLRRDAERESLPERFDLVISIQVVEHILDDIAALRNMATMSAGHVFISTMSGRMRPSEIGIGHLRSYSRLELSRKLERAGLEVVDMYGWGFPFYSPFYRTLCEWLPGGPPAGRVGPVGRIVAKLIYHLYRLNFPGRGDVLGALARVPA